MTIRTESRICIERPPAVVWAYLCDVGRWPEWAPTVVRCWVRGGGPLQPGSRVEQRAKAILGLTHGRSQEMTAAEAPRSMAFAGPMGTSAARWGMELETVDAGKARKAGEARHTDAMMWVEVDLAGWMRTVPTMLRRRVQRVSDQEMALIKAAVEADVERTARGGFG